MKLCNLRGTLCIGGMSLKNVDVFMDEKLLSAPAEWSGQIQVDRSDQHSLELERQYLLMLGEDCMGCVKLVSFLPGSDVSHVVAEFVTCSYR